MSEILGTFQPSTTFQGSCWCSACYGWVIPGHSHTVTGIADPPAAFERIAAALERIATALERSETR
jgi:hypothetical protein